MNPFFHFFTSTFDVARSRFNVLSLYLLLLLGAPALLAQQNGIAQDSQIVIVPTGGNLFQWFGNSGRSYFIQVSDTNTPLAKWHWTPFIESGIDEPISHEVGATTGRAFFRLKYTDQLPGPGETLDTADFDSDGLSNLKEIVPPLPLSGADATDPLDPDTDHDGLPDGWERAHSLNPNQPADAALLFPGSTLTHLAAFQAGVQDHPDATPTDKDGDRVDNPEDAVPEEILAAWETTPESRFIKLEVKNIPEGYFAIDMNGKGQILFMDSAAYSFPNDTFHGTPVGAVWTPGRSDESSWEEIFLRPEPFKMRGRKHPSGTRATVTRVPGGRQYFRVREWSRIWKISPAGRCQTQGDRRGWQCPRIGFVSLCRRASRYVRQPRL